MVYECFDCGKTFDNLKNAHATQIRECLCYESKRLLKTILLKTDSERLINDY